MSAKAKYTHVICLKNFYLLVRMNDENSLCSNITMPPPPSLNIFFFIKSIDMLILYSKTPKAHHRHTCKSTLKCFIIKSRKKIILYLTLFSFLINNIFCKHVISCLHCGE